MSFPRYAKYKDSGVEWLGEVPAALGRVKQLSMLLLSRSGTTTLRRREYAGRHAFRRSSKDLTTAIS